MPRRRFDELRPILITPHFLAHPEGSALIACGDTKVLCTASVEDRVPNWMTGKGRGWITAEYDMLPRATTTRNMRDSHRGKVSGRTQEISRLVGRALRGAVDFAALGERTLTIDCDVLQADGGTRTAAITGGYVALALAIKTLQASGKIKTSALRGQIAATSVGIIDGSPFLDLDYSMDARADVDMNVVMTAEGELVEVQGTGEGGTFRRQALDQMLDLALGALPNIIAVQQRAIATPLSDELVSVTA